MQSFDIEVFAEYKFTGKIENVAFVSSTMEVAILDDLNQITLYNYEANRISGMTRFPMSDFITMLQPSLFSNDLLIYTS